MRHLAFRFVRHEVSGAQFVVDPYLDYRQRLNSNWHKSLQRRKLNVDYDSIKNGYFKWWQLFGEYNKDPSRQNKVSLLDNSNGLVDVLKLPNTVVDLDFNCARTGNEPLQVGTKNEAETIEWLSEQIYAHLSTLLPNAVRQSTSYRIRPALLDACNLQELEFPRIAENDLFTSLVGISLPGQLAPFVKNQFVKRNNFPLNLISNGAAYRGNSVVEQDFKTSLLNVNQGETEAIASFNLIANSIASFLGQLGIDYEIEMVKPEELSTFEAASILFKCKTDVLSKVSFIGSYISERLNIQLESVDGNPKFAILCHADLNLSRICDLLE